MTALSDRLEAPNTKKLALLEVTAGERLYFWTLSTGYTYTYEAAISHRVTGIRANGAALNARASIAAVDATASTYYWDQAAAKVYVHCPAGVSPYTLTMQALVRFDLSTRDRVIDGRFYDGRILSLPTLSMRIEAAFGDPGQIGAGSVTLANGDGFFDDLADLQWDAGGATLKLGIDEIVRAVKLGPGVDGVEADIDGGFVGSDEGGGVGMALEEGVAARVYRECDYADYETLGAWRVTGWTKKNSAFSLTLEEKKGCLKKKIPVALYSRTAYPSMEEYQVGEVIPIAYGTIYDVRPTCIHTDARQFKVANHAIKEFMAVRVRKLASEDAETETWVDVSFETNTEATATFTLAAADWDGDAEVAVDFRGRMNANGTLMVNPADVVRDLLTYWLAEPAATIDTASFAASWNFYNIGYDADGNPVTHLAISMYLNEATEATDIFSTINATAGSYFYNGLDGKYRFIAFNPIPGESCLRFDENEIQSFEDITDATEIFSSVRAGYQYRAEQDYAQVYTYERAEAQYLQGSNTAVLLDLENLPLSEVADARYVAQRSARMDGERLRKFKVRLNHRGWRLRPADFIYLSYERHGVDGVFEVLEVRRNLENTLWADVVLGNLHGMGNTVGFWVSDTPTFPSRLGGGSCAAWSSVWTDAQKAWARQNVGYWTDDNGFADSADPDSFMAGAWI